MARKSSYNHNNTVNNKTSNCILSTGTMINGKPLNKTHLIAFSGLMAAVICVATGFIKFPTPIGYIHIGDGFIFLAVALLGYYGIASAAIGSALADLLAGYFIYAPGTFIIKGIMGLIAYKYIKQQYTTVRCIVGYLLAEILMVMGYFVYEIPIYGIKAASTSMFFNDVQGFIGIILGTVVVMTIANRLNAVKKHKKLENKK